MKNYTCPITGTKFEYEKLTAELKDGDEVIYSYALQTKALCIVLKVVGRTEKAYRCEPYDSFGGENERNKSYRQSIFIPKSVVLKEKRTGSNGGELEAFVTKQHFTTPLYNGRY